jgi:hypothetical protein
MADDDKDLLNRKPDILMPSAEGATGYPRDLLELSVEDLNKLIGENSNGNGNGGPHSKRGSDSAPAGEIGD